VNAPGPNSGPESGTRHFAGPQGASTKLVLASASAVRGRLLSEAGIAFEQVPAAVDEAELKASMHAESASVADAATALAEFKATRISARHPQALVIGADQILECGGAWFDKPVDRSAAAAALSALSGREHRLVSAACAVRGGTRIWQASDSATLHMRELDADFIERYLDAAGPTVMKSVGVYQLEGLGTHLFSRIEGDYFTILGLPLLPLLAFLREHGVVP